MRWVFGGYLKWSQGGFAEVALGVVAAGVSGRDWVSSVSGGRPSRAAFPLLRIPVRVCRGGQLHGGRERGRFGHDRAHAQPSSEGESDRAALPPPRRRRKTGSRLAFMTIDQWWPRLSAETREQLAANNGDIVPAALKAEIEEVGGPAASDPWWEEQDGSDGRCMPDEAVDWIEAWANGE